MRKLIKSALECIKCGDVIVSKHRHDWVKCSCGAIYLDGGCADYRRFGGKSEDIIDRAEYIDKVDKDEAN